MKDVRMLATTAFIFIVLMTAAACSAGRDYRPAVSPAASQRTTYAPSTPRPSAASRTTSTPRSTLTPQPTSTPRPSRRPVSTPRPSDPFDVHDYSHPDDFYYDHRDDFFDYEDAEDYFNDHDDYDFD